METIEPYIQRFDLATDEYLVRFLEDVADLGEWEGGLNAAFSKALLTSAERLVDDEEIELEDLIGALDHLADQGEEILEDMGFSLEWDDGGYRIYQSSDVKA